MLKSLCSTLIIFSFAFLFIACDNSDDPITNTFPKTEGMGYAATDSNAIGVYTAIVTTLTDNPNIGIVAQIDHAANAENASLPLDFTRTVIFGNPNLGTPLMQINPQVGLDLPQKIIVYTDTDGQTVAAYNSTDYLSNRHNVGSAATIDMISGALSNIVAAATDSTTTVNADTTTLNEGIITVQSSNDFDTTYSNIVTELSNIEPISIIAEVNHQANAASIDVTLNPLRLIVFGNPALGTPLMQESSTTAVDLPQKMLVYQNDMDEVVIIYNDPFFTAERHGVTDNDDTLTTISGALENIANAGAQ